MPATLHKCTTVHKLNTGATIPAVGLGTWRSTEDEGYDSTLAALKAGYRHIDDAAIYLNEAAVGRAIRDSGVPRAEIFVTTKLWGTQHRNPQEALDESLKRLGLDYVDLYLMHWPVAFKTDHVKDGNYLTIPKNEKGEPDTDVKDWSFIKSWELMQELPKSGKTKAIGVSNFSVKNLEDLLKASTTKIVPAVNQVETHPLLPQDELLAYGKEKGILLEAYSPFGSQGSPLLLEAVVKEIAEKNNVDPGQLLVSWGVQRGYVILPKSKNPSRIASNFHVIDLSDEDMKALHNISKEKGEKRFNTMEFPGFKIFE
ncbi:LAMI_0E13806g1_1 [Lachancea mirantina]|uniref:LAMI_0E13806g1_1 n=1 Tax=Lachancea mirantina TaxID=1230905 RepID=A0A1G4JR45_9SACH|nr:LAMI_0E13806g1_1 [Lachancea mirantina]